jgi:hypothetical protein
MPLHPLHLSRVPLDFLRIANETCKHFQMTNTCIALYTRHYFKKVQSSQSHGMDKIIIIPTLQVRKLDPEVFTRQSVSEPVLSPAPVPHWAASQSISK